MTPALPLAVALVLAAATQSKPSPQPSKPAPPQSKPAPPASQASRPAASQALDDEAQALFKEVTPELDRYRRLAIYGQSRSKIWPTEAVIDREASLFDKRKAAGALDAMNNLDWHLCYNLLLHRPKVGREYFDLLVGSPTMPANRLVTRIFPELVSSGEWGEQRALKGAKETDVDRRRAWATALAGAVHVSSRAPMESWLLSEADDPVAVSLLGGLCNIGDKASIPTFRKVLETSPSDARRARALFSLVDLLGRKMLPELEKMTVKGEKTKAERDDAIQYLKKSTTDANPLGYSVGNDPEFVARFGDLYATPVIAWLKAHGRLEEPVLSSNDPFTPAEKAQLFDALDEGFAFGLAAVKGSLFKSLDAKDLPRLLKLWELNAYSPSSFTESHFKTLRIMIHSIRLR